MQAVLEDTAPRYLLRDRDRIFEPEFVQQVKAMGIKQVLSAPRSPWQRAYVERVIGTIRRECLDHMIVFNERSLYRHLHCFVDYYHRSRTHLGFEKDTPESRPVQSEEAGRSFLFQRSEDSTTVTSAAPPERRAFFGSFQSARILGNAVERDRDASERPTRNEGRCLEKLLQRALNQDDRRAAAVKHESVFLRLPTFCHWRHTRSISGSQPSICIFGPYGLSLTDREAGAFR